MNPIRFAALPLVLTACIAICRGGTTDGKPRPDVLIDDFESCRFDNWTVEGAAFGKGPLEIEGLDSPKPKSLSNNNWEALYCPGRQGKYVAHSASDRNNGPQGMLTNQPFAIDRRAMRFLIGGGSSPATRVDLLVDGKVVMDICGKYFGKMAWSTRHCWAIWSIPRARAMKSGRKPWNPCSRSCWMQSRFN
jgi:hypothetical protein